MNAGSALNCFLAIILSFVFSSCQHDQAIDSGQSQVLSEGSIPDLLFYGAFPNPFTVGTILAYQISSSNADKIEIVIYNSSGERIKTYTSPSNDSTNISAFNSSAYAFTIGYSECHWDGNSDNGQAPNGIYYVEARATKGDQTIIQRTTCMRRR